MWQQVYTLTSWSVSDPVIASSRLTSEHTMNSCVASDGLLFSGTNLMYTESLRCQTERVVSKYGYVVLSLTGMTAL